MTTILAACLLAAASAPPDAQSMLERLDRTRMTLDLDSAYVPDVVGLVSDFTGVTILCDEAVVRDLPDDQRVVTIRVRELPARTVLKLILKPRHLALVVRDGIPVVVRDVDVASATITRVYDIRDLTFEIQDFPAPVPDFGIQAQQANNRAAQSLRFLDDLFEDDPVQTTITEDRIQELIETHTGGGSWTDNPRVNLTLMGGRLVVTQSEEVHRQIQELLDELARFR